MKLLDLLNSRNALEKLFSQDLPVRVSYKLSKFIKAVNKEFDEFDEFRRKLLDKYGERQEGGEYRVEEDNLKFFKEDMGVILDTSLNIEFPTFTISELENAQMSGKDLSVLDYLISE